jgi:tetratricopeptide (TPR) repeat protein
MGMRSITPLSQKQFFTPKRYFVSLEYRRKVEDQANQYYKEGLESSKHGDFRSAEKSFEMALFILVKDFGEHHPYVFEFFNTLGRTFAEESNFSDAFLSFKKAKEVLNRYYKSHTEYYIKL